jgi:hypothetical protein
MRYLAIIALVSIIWGGTLMAAHATEIADPQEVAVTIYNNDLALIRETREFNLAAGTQTLLLPNVSGKLRPETVHLSFPSSVEFSLLEQNFDYDLVSSDKLLEKFIGKQITVIDDEHNLSFTGELLSVAGGRVIRTADGQILLNPVGRVELPQGAADGLLLRPTLSWLLWAKSAGAQKGEISYLSSGLTWNADYVVMVSADDKLGDLEGWVSISNYSGTTYNDAKLKLVAGDVNVVKPNAPPAPMMMEMKAAAGAAPRGFQEEQFFEYHLYDLQRPTTLRNNQLKQVGLLTANGVPMKKIMEYDGINGGDVRVLMEFKNDEKSGMGMPLPAGTVRLFKADKSGSAQFIGENRIDHTPKDETVKLFVGNAFDIKGETVRTDYKDLKDGYESSYKVVLKNHKEKEDVVITVPVNVMGDWKMLKASYDYKDKDAFTKMFEIPVKAGGEVELTFSFRVTWR